jgi:hypothetical protein
MPRVRMCSVKLLKPTRTNGLNLIAAPGQLRRWAVSLFVNEMSIRLPNARVACLIFTLALLFGCHAKRSVDTQQSAPLTPVAQEIQRRGYHAKESLIVPPTAWEVSTFRMRSKRFFSFRADQSLPNTRDTYCRLVLFEETYDSVDDARQRLTNLHRSSPDSPEGDEYVRAMRTGFRVGAVAYVLQTDAIIFWDEVQRLAKALANSTQDAELSRAMINSDVRRPGDGRA